MRSYDRVAGFVAIFGVAACGGRVVDGSSAGLSGAGGASCGAGHTCNPVCAGPNCATRGVDGTTSSNPGGPTNLGGGGAIGSVAPVKAPPPGVGTSAVPPSISGSSGSTGRVDPPPSVNPPPTGTANTVPTPAGNPADADAGPIYYTFGGVTRDGRLLAAYWTGREEAMVFLNPETGATTFAGNLCDLYLWEPQFVYDEARGLVYAIGDDRVGTTHVYTLNLATKTCTSVSFSPGQDDGGLFHYIVGGVTPDGRIVAAHWDGQAEATVLIDPATGASTFVGSMGDLYVWQGQFAYNDGKNTAYAIGEDRAGTTHLYSLSLSSGVSSRADVHPAETDGGTIDYYVFGGTTSNGLIVAAYWNGVSEQTVMIDPTTGHVSIVGYLGDLYTWQGQLLYSRHTGVVYAFGTNRAGDQHFYLLPIRG